MARILIIDDSTVMRTLLCDLLAEDGHHVEATGDSLEGVRKATEQQFDICICDLHIPKKNGYEILRDVAPHRPSLRFIMTDSLPDELGRKVRESGSGYYLRKPFDVEQLREIVRQILRTVPTP